MRTYQFSRTPPSMGEKIEQPPEEEIKNTLGLWNASVEDAVRYGGEVTRQALSVVPFRNDRKYVVVDTKIHMLMKGQSPAIPGWHTDGVPRQPTGEPFGGPPNLIMQDEACTPTGVKLRPPHYHLLVTGKHCLTQYVDEPFAVPLADDVAQSPQLYAKLTEFVNTTAPYGLLKVEEFPSCQVSTWDWWLVHQGVPSTGAEWRFLMRVTETDYIQPQTDLRQVLRTQQNVYVPTEFGW